MKQTEMDSRSGETGLTMPKQPETGSGIGETGTMLLNGYQTMRPEIPERGNRTERS